MKCLVGPHKDHRELSIHIDRVLCETFLWPSIYRHKMGKEKIESLSEIKNIYVLCYCAGLWELISRHLSSTAGSWIGGGYR